MSWIIDVELVEVLDGQPPDLWHVVFDVIYPGETWCRSIVRLTAAFSGADELEVVGRARDALLSILELQAGPASADIRLTSDGINVLHIGAPG